MKTKHIEGYVNNYVFYEDGRVWSMATKRFLTPHFQGSGYLFVTLFADGKRKQQYIHRLVAQAFIPNEENKSDVNHIDGNKVNNHRSNLEWTTRSENLIHAHKKGFLNQSRTGIPRMGKEQAQEIYNLKGKMSGAKIAEKFNVGKSTVYDILNGVTWKSLDRLPV